MTVLFFSQWYPNRRNAMDGIFVRKHAQAVARFCDVEVLYLQSDQAIRDFEIVDETIENVREVTVYFPKSRLPILDKFSAGINYFRAFCRGMKLMKKPDITQTNVIERDGLLSLWLKWTQKIPYICVEHWTHFLPQNFSYTCFFQKRMTETIVRNAEMILPVSNDLAYNMKKNGLDLTQYDRVDNVVCDFFYQDRAKKEREKKLFITIADFRDNAKNNKGTLRAIKELSKKRDDFEAIFVGTGPDFDDVYKLYESLDFPPEMIKFVGEKTPEEVCDLLYQSDFMILFSNYENAPCVISEALAVGRPIISTKVGGVPEMIDKNSGVLVQPKDEKSFVEAMDKMLDTFGNYDREKIRESGKKYSYDTVGKRLYDIYDKILKK